MIVTVTARLAPISDATARSRGRCVAALTAERADTVGNTIATELTRAGANVVRSEFVPHLPQVLVEADAPDLYRVSVAVDNVRRITGGTGHAVLVDWTSTD